MKGVPDVVFGATTGISISLVSGYPVWDWHWWAAFIPIIITGIVFAYSYRGR